MLLNVLILAASLPDPSMTLMPAVFPVGKKYVATCALPQGDFKNVTLSLYDRILLKPGNSSFEYIGSRSLGPGEWGASITRMSSENSLEYMCEMEVFFNGKTMRSKSKSVSAAIGIQPKHRRLLFVLKLCSSSKCYIMLLVVHLHLHLHLVHLQLLDILHH